MCTSWLAARCLSLGTPSNGFTAAGGRCSLPLPSRGFTVVGEAGATQQRIHHLSSASVMNTRLNRSSSSRTCEHGASRIPLDKPPFKSCFVSLTWRYVHRAYVHDCTNNLAKRNSFPTKPANKRHNIQTYYGEHDNNTNNDAILARHHDNNNNLFHGKQHTTQQLNRYTPQDNHNFYVNTAFDPRLTSSLSIACSLWLTCSVGGSSQAARGRVAGATLAPLVVVEVVKVNSCMGVSMTSSCCFPVKDSAPPVQPWAARRADVHVGSVIPSRVASRVFIIHLPSLTSWKILKEEVAKALFDLEVSNSSDIKIDLKDVVISNAVDLEVKNRIALIIHVPYRVWKTVRKIQGRLIREPEKKFNEKHVIFVANRTILDENFRRKGLKIRPRSMTLTSVHESILENVVGCTEIFGKRTRISVDGTKLMKIHLLTNFTEELKDVHVHVLPLNVGRLRMHAKVVNFITTAWVSCGQHRFYRSGLPKALLCLPPSSLLCPSGGVGADRVHSGYKTPHSLQALLCP